MDGTFNQVNQLNNQFAHRANLNGLVVDDSDSSSGVSSYVSQLVEAHTQQYYQKYQEDNAQHLATLSPEERQEHAEQFQTQFAQHFALQLIQIQQAQYVSSSSFVFWKHPFFDPHTHM